MTPEQLEAHSQRASDWVVWRRYAVPLLVAAGLLVGGSAPFHANFFR